MKKTADQVLNEVRIYKRLITDTNGAEVTGLIINEEFKVKFSSIDSDIVQKYIPRFQSLLDDMKKESLEKIDEILKIEK